MKHKITVFISLFISLCFLTACVGNNEIKAIQDRGELRVGVKADVPRFGLLDLDSGELKGMEIDLARVLAKDILGDENAVKFIIVGNAQMRAAVLENGQIDVAIATFTITEERKEKFNFSSPYFTDELSCLVRTGSAINEIKDLDKKTAGVVRGTTSQTAFVGECEKLGIDTLVSEYSSYPEIKEALVSGKVDAFVADKSILYGYLDDRCLLLDDGFNPQEYGIACKLEDKKLAARIETLLSNMENSGELTAIFEKWGLSQ